MNKLGHLIVTKNLTRGLELKKRHCLCLMFGSIVPDLLVHTYAGGHTRSASEEMIYGKMLDLKNSGGPSCLSFLRLGYILHYVQDYFTYPHNDWYPHGLKNHIAYECALTAYAWRWRYLPPAPYKAVPQPELRAALTRLHGRYEKGKPCVSHDFSYIRRAGFSVIDSYLRLWQ